MAPLLSPSPRTIAAIAVIISSLSVHASRPLPADNEIARFQAVTPLVPDLSNDRPTWDMSLCDRLPLQGDMKFNWLSDTCFQATLPGIRYTFAVRGDSVIRKESDTHFIHIDTSGQIESLSVGAETDSVNRYRVTGRAFQYEYIAGHGATSLSNVARGTLILPDHDTIADVSLVHRHDCYLLAFDVRKYPDTDSIKPEDDNRLLRHIDTYTWTAGEFCVPLAQTSVTTDSVGGEPYAEPRVWTWICPPDVQVLPRGEHGHRSKAYGRQAEAGKTRSGYDSALQPVETAKLPAGITVNTSGTGLTVDGACPVNGEVEMILTDMLGRVFASRPRQTFRQGEQLSWSVDKSTLPPGEYILHIKISPTALYTQKIIIR